jgi:prophage regulatory protein
MNRRKKAAEQWGLSVSQSYVHEHEGLIPPFIAIGAREKAIPQGEIDAINEARIAGKTDDEIRLLVKQLLANRKTIGTQAV